MTNNQHSISSRDKNNVDNQHSISSRDPFAASAASLGPSRLQFVTIIIIINYIFIIINYSLWLSCHLLSMFITYHPFHLKRAPYEQRTWSRSQHFHVPPGQVGHYHYHQHHLNHHSHHHHFYHHPIPIPRYATHPPELCRKHIAPTSQGFHFEKFMWMQTII